MITCFVDGKKCMTPTECFTRKCSRHENNAFLWLDYYYTTSGKPPSALPTDSVARKETPICTGVLDYFPKALSEVARLSKAGNDKHNPGQPLHWAREKSTDHADCIIRHMLDRGTVDEFGFLHEVSVAWRALAQLEVAIEKQAANK